MIDRYRVLATLMTVTLAAASFASELDVSPQGVSPGFEGSFAVVEGRCPTFNWVAVPGARLYELVVYEVDATTLLDGIDALEHAVVSTALVAEVAGGATGWTPELARCLEPGEHYAWFVRAVDDRLPEEPGEWSLPLAFAVSQAPSTVEVEAAMDVLRRFMAVNPIDVKRAGQTGSSAIAADRAAVDDAAVMSSKAGPRSVPNGVAAIRGEQPDPSGETYGVVGFSSSPTGAGMGAANANLEGADLVLDGSIHGRPDAIFTESGVDRPAITSETFTFSNSAGGGMTLAVGGRITGDGRYLSDVVAADVDCSGCVGSDDICSGCVGSDDIDDAVVKGDHMVASTIGGRELRMFTAVRVECNGECDDGTLGDICGSSNKVVSVSCRNIEEFVSPSSCGGDNECRTEPLDTSYNLGTYCKDGSDWDAIVTCVSD